MHAGEDSNQTETVPSPTVSRCRNCGAPLSGEYCSRCGQRERGRDIRLGELVGDAMDELVHPGSRLWRTLLGLLFRPGHITAEYLAGHRARFLPPVRLYLVISFCFFLAVNLLQNEDLILIAPSDPEALAELEAQIDDEEDRKRFREGIAESRAQPDYGDFDLWPGDAPPPDWVAELEIRLENNLEDIRADPKAFSALLVERVPQLLFLLVPVFALLMRVAYLSAPFHYLQHLIFSLHFHSFIFLLSLLLMPVNRMLEWDSGGPVLLIGLLYFPLALRKVYLSTWPGALAKTPVLFISYAGTLAAAFFLYFLVNLALA